MKDGKATAGNLKMATAMILLIAGLAGFCTMAYEVIWFRILKYFVDNSIHSFGIILTTFLFGLAIGGYLFSLFIDSRKDSFLFLGFIETGIGFMGMLSIPVISRTNSMILALNRIFGTGWSGEITIRFIVFSLIMLVPTALIGGAFPLIVKMYTKNTPSMAKSIGEVYAINTVGCVLGSFAGGFVIIPLIGVQYGITFVSLINLFIGLACLSAGSKAGRKAKITLSVIVTAAAAVLLASIPKNAFLHIYDSKYPAPANRMLYLKENINGTTAVFQDTKRGGQKYLLIDGTGEVSTDYYSMRAFRFLGILPALYSSKMDNALIVTFGSGIVAGTITGLPGIKQVDCVEICQKAFKAADFFSKENHDILNNPKINLIVNDGRNHIFTTEKQYDIISADATHPTSSDSWILYTKEFYELCGSRMSDGGVMCQWIPLHGILERDYMTILRTFHSVFPYVAVYYTGGHKTIGHTVLMGSKKEMKIDFQRAQKLFEDRMIREDLARINVFGVFDLLNCFVLDQEAVDKIASGVPLNTDDRPYIIFSKFELMKRPYMGIEPISKQRKNIFPQLYNTGDDSAAAMVRQKIDENFKAMGYSLKGQTLEYEEYIMRMGQDFDQPKEIVLGHLEKSRSFLEQALYQYQTALHINPDDYNTKYLFERASSEYGYLNSFIESMRHGR